MADSTSQDLWAQETEQLLAAPQNPDVALEHLLWGCRQRMDLLRTLAAYALTSGQPLLAASLYQQLGNLEDRCESLAGGLVAPTSRRPGVS